MGQGHNTQGNAHVETIHTSVSHFINTWQGRQVAPEAALGNSSSDFETKAPHISRETYTAYTDRWGPVKYVYIN